MPPLPIDQRRLQTLSQLLTAGGHTDVRALLSSAMESLVRLWPASGGALLYITPHHEVLQVEHGTLDDEARTLIAQARQGFARRADGGEPTVGYFALDATRQMIELPLRGEGQAVGLLHLIVADSDGDECGQYSPETDLLMLLVRAIGGEADKLSKLRRAEQDLRELNLLYEVGRSLAANLDLDSLLGEIKRRAPEVIGAERCTMFLLDAPSQELVAEIMDGSGLREFRIPMNQGIAGWVATHGLGQIVNDVEQDPRWYDGVARDLNYATRSILCAPMKVNDQVVGVVQVINKRTGDPFTDQDLRLLTTLASQAAVAIENARLVRSLKEERDRLLTKEAEVRAAIARDLHDGPTQSVAAIAMNIEFVKKLLRAMPERVPAELEVLLELVRKTTHDIRTLLFELRPLGLETQGLLVTLQQYVSRFRDPSGAMQLRLEAPHEVPRLAPEIEAAIFIIVQEAVNNARKHAQSPEVSIYLYEEEGQLVASVRDRGKGFDIEAVDAAYTTRGSLGLLNMRERARLINGDIRIRSTPGKGTTVELRVPAR